MLTIRGRPRPPLDAVNRPEIALVVGPLVPDGDAVFLQPADVALAAQEPQQFVRHRAEVHGLGGDQRERRRQVVPQPLAEEAERARAGAVLLARTGFEHPSQQVFVLGVDGRSVEPDLARGCWCADFSRHGRWHALEASGYADRGHESGADPRPDRCGVMAARSGTGEREAGSAGAARDGKYCRPTSASSRQDRIHKPPRRDRRCAGRQRLRIGEIAEAHGRHEQPAYDAVRRAPARPARLRLRPPVRTSTSCGG